MPIESVLHPFHVKPSTYFVCASHQVDNLHIIYINKYWYAGNISELSIGTKLNRVISGNILLSFIFD